MVLGTSPSNKGNNLQNLSKFAKELASMMVVGLKARIETIRSLVVRWGALYGGLESIYEWGRIVTSWGNIMGLPPLPGILRLVLVEPFGLLSDRHQYWHI